MLADHFEHVVLIEKDTFPAFGEYREDVSQGKHTHVLLERGREIIVTFFPGLTNELMGNDAVHAADDSLNIYPGFIAVFP